MDMIMFKDILFDVINESDELMVKDLYDMNGGYMVVTEDGERFFIHVEKHAPEQNG